MKHKLYILKNQGAGLVVNAKVLLVEDTSKEGDVIRHPANIFKFIQKGVGKTNLTIDEIGDIFCGWTNDGTIRYTEAVYLGGLLTDSNNFTPLIQTEL